LQAAGGALSWCCPFTKVIKKRSIIFGEGVKIFILKTVETGFRSGIR